MRALLLNIIKNIRRNNGGRIMKNYTIIIFGGTGDLAKRKLFPAITTLLKTTPDFNITVLGIGRKEYNDQEYRNHVISDTLLPENMHVHYFIADVEKKNSLKGLKKKLESIETAEPDGRVFYLATSYTLFGNIAKSIHPCFQEH